MPCTRELIILVSAATALCIATLLIYIWTILRRRCHWTDSRQKNHSIPSESSLLRVQGLLCPPGATISQLLLERSNANARLSRTLGLTNTFVSPDLIVHDNFVQHARMLLKGVQQNGWPQFQEVCRQSVQLTLQDWHSVSGAPNPSSSICFDHFVQIVVLRLVLVGLLDVGREVEELNISSLAFVTTSINDLWTHSKTGLPPPLPLIQQLHEHLRSLVPVSAGYDNPLNFVIPTWETMWRVCATTIARAQDSEEYKLLLHNLVRTDSLTTQRIVSAGGQGFSARDFVNEVMRLHPPVKHISRIRQSAHSSPPPSPTFSLTTFRRLGQTLHRVLFRSQETICDVADIETMLQTKTIWNDAHVFKPERHRFATPEMKGAQKLVFGHGPLRCVAASWAPDAAAVVAATIMEECENLDWILVTGVKIGGRTGWEEWKLMKSE